VEEPADERRLSMIDMTDDDDAKERPCPECRIRARGKVVNKHIHNRTHLTLYK
jgi:hypothetical protein